LRGEQAEPREPAAGALGGAAGEALGGRPLAKKTEEPLLLSNGGAASNGDALGQLAPSRLPLAGRAKAEDGFADDAFVPKVPTIVAAVTASSASSSAGAAPPPAPASQASGSALAAALAAASSELLPLPVEEEDDGVDLARLCSVFNNLERHRAVPPHSRDDGAASRGIAACSSTAQPPVDSQPCPNTGVGMEEPSSLPWLAGGPVDHRRCISQGGAPWARDESEGIKAPPNSIAMPYSAASAPGSRTLSGSSTPTGGRGGGRVARPGFGGGSAAAGGTSHLSMSSPSGSRSSEDGRYSSTPGHPGSTGGQAPQGTMTVPDFLLGGQAGLGAVRRQSTPGLVETLPDAAAGRLRDAQRMDAWFQRVLKKGESKGSQGPSSPGAAPPRPIGGGAVLPVLQTGLASGLGRAASAPQTAPTRQVSTEDLPAGGRDPEVEAGTPRAAPGDAAGSAVSFRLEVLLSGEFLGTLSFSIVDSVDAACRAFVERHRLRAIFLQPLQGHAELMAHMGKRLDKVDVIDLI